MEVCLLEGYYILVMSAQYELLYKQIHSTNIQVTVNSFLSPKLKTEYRNESPFRKPSFLMVLGSFIETNIIF